jgi:hypothetical protein
MIIDPRSDQRGMFPAPWSGSEQRGQVAASTIALHGNAPRPSEAFPWNHIFLGFMDVIFIALLICIEQPAISCCDMDDFAAVISCIAMVLFSPSGIFIVMSSALAMLASVHPANFDFADAGTADIAISATAATKANLQLMFVSSTKSWPIANRGERACAVSVPQFHTECLK